MLIGIGVFVLAAANGGKKNISHKSTKTQNSTKNSSLVLSLLFLHFKTPTP
jgi:hypothetical protein